MKLGVIINTFRLVNKGLTSIINFILLSIVYFVGIGITSIIVRLIKKESLSNKINSSWEQFKLSEKKEDYYRMF